VTKLLLFINLLFTSYPAPAAGPDTLISCHVSKMPFAGFCQFIYEESGVKIYYQDSWVEGVTVTIDSERISVKSAVELALQGTGMEVSTWNNGLVILPGEKLPEELPRYNARQTQTYTSAEGGKMLTQSEERYLTGRKADVTQVLQIGKKGLSGTKSQVTIRGRITDQETGEPVIGATLFIEQTKSGTSTDKNGFLSMVIKPGSYTGVFAYMGMESKKYQLEVLSDGDFSEEMSKKVIQMKEVVVLGDQQMNIRFKDAGLEIIFVETIQEIPTMMGERDILKVSEM